MPVFCNEPIGTPLRFSLGLPAVSWCNCFKAWTQDKPSQFLLSESKDVFIVITAKVGVDGRFCPTSPPTPKRVLQHTWVVNPTHHMDVNPSHILHFTKHFHLSEALRIGKQMIQFWIAGSYPNDVRKSMLSDIS